MKATIQQCSDAIIQSCGIITQAAKDLGISRNALHKRINSSEKLQSALHESREVLIDKGESALVKAVDNNESWAVSLLLKTLGRNRGYIEKQEIGVEGPISVIVNKFADNDSK